MRLCKVLLPSAEARAAVLEGDHVRLLWNGQDSLTTLSEVLHDDNPEDYARALLGESIALSKVRLLPPLDHQEVWAAGVTYKRSREARERESAGAARFYDLVYTAARPELFFKATARRVVGPGDHVCIRKDARWSVPEPELALVVSPALKIVGYTIGNDMSSRDIEGENPLYLPQAKVYNASCSVGPVITLAGGLPSPEQTTIRLVIERNGGVAFDGSTTLAAMARSFEELVSWLGRDNSFPDGVILLTGTGIVPPDSFTLQSGDRIRIEVTGIGTLENVVQ
jgi:2-dehydro-3-deoxy-D-arabinonate dehydratase